MARQRRREKVWQSEPIVVAAIGLLSAWRDSPWQHEADCRHGIRSGLCLRGHSWTQSDEYAQAVVASALKHLGVTRRPTWHEARPEHVEELIHRRRCVHCTAPIPEGRRSRSGAPTLYCSEDCATKAYQRRASMNGEAVDWETHLAKQAARSAQTRADRARTCPQCKRRFETTKTDATFCSEKCQAKARTFLQVQPCKNCGKAYRPTSSKKQQAGFCSRDCYDASRARTPNICAGCGAAFTPRKRGEQGRAQRFCSYDCSVQARRDDKFACEALGP
ncbi:MAG: hypothetical protein WBW73_25995 [Rhodoplanes sp.]